MASNSYHCKGFTVKIFRPSTLRMMVCRGYTDQFQITSRRQLDIALYDHTVNLSQLIPSP
jgi:hypothetical protein